MTDEWAELAATATQDDLRERILTGFKEGKPFTPCVPTIALPAPTGDVVDFGCGLGRNLPSLRSIASRVVGYDLPPMFGFSALDLIARTGPFDGGECRVVDHDPDTHQLRVLGTLSFDEARSAADPRHFEVLLHSRTYRR